ncbi:MAG: hypothetical protein ABL876_14320 [Chitinophagaceae bacterium]
MKLKLTYAEFKTLHSLLQRICIGILPKGIQARVLHGVLFRLYRKFYNKAIEVKKKYSISMEDDEACAFYMFLSSFDMTGEEVFTINLVHQINISIHQKYSA